MQLNGISLIAMLAGISNQNHSRLEYNMYPFLLISSEICMSSTAADFKCYILRHQTKSELSRLLFVLKCVHMEIKIRLKSTLRQQVTELTVIFESLYQTIPHDKQSVVTSQLFCISHVS